MSPPTFTERFDLGGLAGREPKVIHGTKMGNREGFSKLDVYERIEPNIRKITNSNTGSVRYQFFSETTGGLTFDGKEYNNSYSNDSLEKVKKFKEEYKKKNLPKNISKQTKYNYTVKNQPNIKYAIMENGTKKYRVSILRDGKILKSNVDGTTSLAEAITERNRLTKLHPPTAPFSTIDQAAHVKKDLKKLADNNYIKKMFSKRDFTLSKTDLRVVAKILNITIPDAERRIFQLAASYIEEGNKKFKTNSLKLINEAKLTNKSAHLVRAMNELKIGKTFNEKSIKTLKADILKNKNYLFNEFYDIDEPHGVKSGIKRKTHPYSIFGQVIKSDINRIEKLEYDGLKSIKEKQFQKALKSKNPNIIKEAVNDYNKFVNEWETKLNKGLKKGQPKIKLFRISTQSPDKTIKNWSKFNDKYKTVFHNNWKNRGYSFVVPKDIKTLPEIKKSMSNIKDVKKMKTLFAVGAKRLLAADPLFWGVSMDDVFKKKAEGKTSMEAMGSLLFLDKPIRKGLKRWKADDQQNLAYDRVNFLKRIQSGDVGLSELSHMARKDPDFDGNYTRYIEFLKVMVADPAQQKLIRERDIQTEKALTLPEDVVEKRKKTYDVWSNIPLVRAIKEQYQSDEQKTKDLENLLNV